MADPALPTWRLIAVLQSTMPLPEALAVRLYHAALALHDDAEGRTRISGDLAQGEVRALGKDLLLGSIGGPGFEADLDTPHGHGRVQFLVTREGLEAGAAAGAGADPRHAPN